LAKNQSKSNSFAVRRKSSLPFVTSRVRALISRPSNVRLSARAALGSLRRRTVRTRAASSRGENGFVT
jgi:hypothetical protein